MPRRLLLLTSLVVLAGASSAQANHPPVTVNFVFRFDVDLGDQHLYRNLAPWYTYFPYDPNIHGRAPHFPTWPQTWPPGTPPTGGGVGRMPPSPTLPTPGTPAALRMTWQPSQAVVRPVSYSQPTYHGAPSYWYGR